MSKTNDEARKKIREESRKIKEEERRKFWCKVDQFLLSECTGTSIADILGVSPDCLYDRCMKDKGVAWSVYAQKKKDVGDSLIKDAQFHVAVRKYSVDMLKFLGKNRLGQTDRQIIQTENLTPAKIVIEIPDNGRRKGISYNNHNETVIESEPIKVPALTHDDPNS